MTQQAVRAIEAQAIKQPIEQCVAAHLRELCADAALAELVAQDLAQPEMSISKCGATLWEHARKHKTGSGYYMSHEEERRLIRAFYGLPEAAPPQRESAPRRRGAPVNLLDYL